MRNKNTNYYEGAYYIEEKLHVDLSINFLPLSFFDLRSSLLLSLFFRFDCYYG